MGAEAFRAVAVRIAEAASGQRKGAHWIPSIHVGAEIGQDEGASACVRKDHICCKAVKAIINTWNKRIE